MLDRGVVALLGLETALPAIAAAATPPGRGGWRPWRPSRGRPGRMLTEDVAKARLAAAGVVVPRLVAAPDLPALAAAAGAAGLRGPLALKGLGLAHKTEAGAVRLNVASLADEAPMPGVSGYAAEEMVTGTVIELLLGARRDPVYGATLTIGAGGVMAELLDDSVTFVLPVEAGDVAAALRRLRIGPLFEGWRGLRAADAQAAVAAAMAMQALLAADPDIAEVEVNPLMVQAEGAVAVDAVIWMQEARE
jgi:hypothetical protein